MTYESEKIKDTKYTSLCLANFFDCILYLFCFPGKLLNGQRLLEFSITPDDRSLNQELLVRQATLWIEMELRPGVKRKRRFEQLRSSKRLTLWIFRLVEQYESYGGGYLDEKVIIFPARHNINSSFMILHSFPKFIPEIHFLVFVKTVTLHILLLKIFITFKVKEYK